MAVDELELASRQFVGEQAAGESDVAIQGAERLTLGRAVAAEVQLVGNQVGGADAAVRFDAVADPGFSPWVAV
jgi:hypothetical protein